ncbi:hypothetical protein BH18ACI4_BH18ACI4_27100 [soil metagenome]
MLRVVSVARTPIIGFVLWYTLPSVSTRFNSHTKRSTR